MKWFRSHIKQGTRLALFALAIQFALAFGHFHGIAAQAAPAVATSATEAPLINGLIVAGTASELPGQPVPASHDPDRQANDACAICAVVTLANTALFATPPSLPLPQATTFSYRAVDTAFSDLNTARTVFQPRAPPLS